MKEINGQLYGYSYELDQTSEDDGTTCYAVDTGTIFFAYSGIWYEQKNAFWQAGGGSSGGGSSLPEVSAADNGDVLTVVSGAWNKADPPSGALVVNVTVNDNRYTCDKTAGEMLSACAGGVVVLATTSGSEVSYSLVVSAGYDEINDYYFDTSASLTYEATASTDYPVYIVK